MPGVVDTCGGAGSQHLRGVVDTCRLVDSCEGSPHLRELDTVVLYVVTDTFVNRDYVETEILSSCHTVM